MAEAESLTQAIERSWRELENRAAVTDEERWAGELLKAVLGAQAWKARDVPGGPSGMHDLDVEFHDGRRIAVEVKTHTSPRRAAFDAERDKRNPLDAPSLQSGWAVDFDVPDDEAADAATSDILLKDITGKLEPILARIEREGLHGEVRHIRDTGGRARSREHPICGELRELRIRRAYPAPWESDGTIRLCRAEAIASFAPSSIANVVKGYVSREYENLTRAKDHGADEVHLFLWIPLGVTRSDQASMATTAIVPGDKWLPPETELRGLDSVWVAKFGLPVDFPELHGFSSPIWQLTESGWCCWTRDWRQLERGRPS